MSGLVCPKCDTLFVGRNKDEDQMRARIAELEARNEVLESVTGMSYVDLLRRAEQAEVALTRIPCPACGHTGSVFAGDGGHPTCGIAECPNPDTADAIKKAEAALAERDRMLRLLVPEFVHGVERSPAGIDDCDSCKHVLSDLRARAEEGSET